VEGGGNLVGSQLNPKRILKTLPSDKKDFTNHFVLPEFVTLFNQVLVEKNT
jgi:hypothetical protein